MGEMDVIPSVSFSTGGAITVIIKWQIEISTLKDLGLSFLAWWEDTFTAIKSVTHNEISKNTYPVELKLSRNIL